MKHRSYHFIRYFHIKIEGLQSLCYNETNILLGKEAFVLKWLIIIGGIALALWQIFYAFVVISSLIENTGSTVLAIIVGVGHALLPVVCVFFGYQWFGRMLAQYGAFKAVAGAGACAVIYLAGVAFWCKSVLGGDLPIWGIGLLTAAQAAVSAMFIYGFVYFG